MAHGIFTFDTLREAIDIDVWCLTKE